MRFLESGCQEPLKGSVHAAMAALALVSCLYNVGKLAKYRRLHHVYNVLFYFSLTAIEIRQAQRHWGRGC